MNYLPFHPRRGVLQDFVLVLRKPDLAHDHPDDPQGLDVEHGGGVELVESAQVEQPPSAGAADAPVVAVPHHTLVQLRKVEIVLCLQAEVVLEHMTW